MSSQNPNTQEHGVRPPAPESLPAENEIKPHGLPKLLSRLSVFTAAIALSCTAFDVVVSLTAGYDNLGLGRVYIDQLVGDSCGVQFWLTVSVIVTWACSRTVPMTKLDIAIRSCAALFILVAPVFWRWALFPHLN